MKVTRLLAVTAAVQADAERSVPTDVYKLAAELQQQFPDLCPKELVTLIEQAIVTIRGAAYWDKGSTSH